ncbi:MAG TPA: ABC transporter substrate-binding protein, partial [Candidatus Baltobacteraceae bacterium]
MKAAGALALAAVLLAGCARAGTRAHDSQTLTIVQQREPLSLNPAMDNGTSSTQWGLLLFSYLVKFDDRDRLVGDVAAQVPSLANGGISKDGRTITYHLRAGVRFSDGVPLTARDCVWSIRAIQNPANDVQSRYGYDRVVAADAPDDRTLVLHLKAPFAPLTTIVLAPQGFPILPAHVLSKYPNFNDVAFNGAPVGSGPYVVRSWNRGDRVELRANPYYFRGKPKIDRMVVRFVADSTTAIDQLRTGEADGFFNDQDLGNYPILRAVPGVRTTGRPMNAVGALIFNTRDPLTADTRVRHALAQGFDIATTVAKAYRGALDAKQAGRGLFIWAYDPAAYPDVAYDPARAARLLDAAGWVRGSDGVRRKGGRSLDLLLIVQAATPGDAVVANVIAKAEEAIGARVEIKAFSANQFVAPASLGGPVYG